MKKIFKKGLLTVTSVASIAGGTAAVVSCGTDAEADTPDDQAGSFKEDAKNLETLLSGEVLEFKYGEKISAIDFKNEVKRVASNYSEDFPTINFETLTVKSALSYKDVDVENSEDGSPIQFELKVNNIDNAKDTTTINVDMVYNLTNREGNPDDETGTFAGDVDAAVLRINGLTFTVKKGVVAGDINTLIDVEAAISSYSTIDSVTIEDSGTINTDTEGNFDIDLTLKFVGTEDEEATKTATISYTVEAGEPETKVAKVKAAEISEQLAETKIFFKTTKAGFLRVWEVDPWNILSLNKMLDSKFEIMVAIGYDDTTPPKQGEYFGYKELLQYTSDNKPIVGEYLWFSVGAGKTIQQVDTTIQYVVDGEVTPFKVKIEEKFEAITTTTEELTTALKGITAKQEKYGSSNVIFTIPSVIDLNKMKIAITFEQYVQNYDEDKKPIEGSFSKEWNTSPWEFITDPTATSVYIDVPKAPGMGLKTGKLKLELIEKPGFKLPGTIAAAFIDVEIAVKPAE